MKFNRVISILNCTPLNATDNYFCGWAQNECTISKRLSRANKFLLCSFLSFFLSFFPRVLAKQTFARVLYPEKKKRIDQKAFNLLAFLPFSSSSSYHDCHLSRQREKRMLPDWSIEKTYVYPEKRKICPFPFFFIEKKKKKKKERRR